MDQTTKPTTQNSSLSTENSEAKPNTPVTPTAATSVTTDPAKVNPAAAAEGTATGQTVVPSASPTVTGPTVVATPETTKKGKTKQKLHNAAVILTELYSQIETLEQLASRSPTTRADILNGILRARDGCIQVQDLLKED